MKECQVTLGNPKIDEAVRTYSDFDFAILAFSNSKTQKKLEFSEPYWDIIKSQLNPLNGFYYLLFILLTIGSLILFFVIACAPCLRMIFKTTKKRLCLYCNSEHNFTSPPRGYLKLSSVEDSAAEKVTKERTEIKDGKYLQISIEKTEMK